MTRSLSEPSRSASTRRLLMFCLIRPCCSSPVNACTNANVAAKIRIRKTREVRLRLNGRSLSMGSGQRPVRIEVGDVEVDAPAAHLVQAARTQARGVEGADHRAVGLGVAAFE